MVDASIDIPKCLAAAKVRSRHLASDDADGETRRQGGRRMISMDEVDESVDTQQTATWDIRPG
jgi:hypothetical protein